MISTKLLYRKLPEKLKKMVDEGKTPDELIVRSAITGSLEGVKLALLLGADVNAMDEWATPLIYASERKYLKVVEFLLKNGANPNIRDRDEKYGGSALAAALRGERRRYPIIEVINLLIEHGADPNVPDVESVTPFMQICEGCNKVFIKIVERMLEKGADVNAKTNSGNTILTRLFQFPRAYEQERVIRILLEKGADLAYARLKAEEDPSLYSNSLAGGRATLAKNMDIFVEKNPEWKTLDYNLIADPGSIELSEKKKAVEKLRKLRKNKMITKVRAKETFERMMSSWNQKIEFGLNGELRKPEKKPDGKNLRKLNRMV